MKKILTLALVLCLTVISAEDRFVYQGNTIQSVNEDDIVINMNLMELTLWQESLLIMLRRSGNIRKAVAAADQAVRELRKRMPVVMPGNSDRKIGE